MIVQTTKAIVLQTHDYKESDRLVTFYTKHGGKIRGIAKGARRSRKRFVNTFELFSLVDLSYRTTKSLVWIEACKLVEPYLELRSDLKRWAYAALACEVVLEMTPDGDPEEELFSLLEGVLFQLSEGKDSQNLILLFLLRFLHTAGYLPALDRCSICDRTLRSAVRWSWNMNRGALICFDHSSPRKGLSLDLGTLMLIQQLRRLPLDKIWRLRVSQDNKAKVFDSLIEWICGQIRKDFKSLKLLGQIRPAQDTP